MPSTRGAATAPTSPTQRDVAAAAGVSTATVSYVLNETQGQSIPVQTRRKVLDAVASTGYVPHAAGRALQRGHARVVMVDVGEMDQSGATLGRLLRGMSDELRRHQHALLITVGGDAHRSHVRSEVAPRTVLDLSRLTLGEVSDDPFSGAVGGEHAGFGYQSLVQLRHLVDAGHRRLAFVAPPAPNDEPTKARIRHVAESARRLGIDAPLVVRLGAEGRAERAVDTLLAAGVTGVAAHDDVTAVRVITSLREVGVTCPDDVAVMGFDDTQLGAFFSPGLTTLRIDAAEYGRRAARLCLGLELRPWTTPPTTVVVRESA